MSGSLQPMSLSHCDYFTYKNHQNTSSLLSLSPLLVGSVATGNWKNEGNIFYSVQKFHEWIFTECLLYIKPMPMIREAEITKCKFFCLLLSLFQSESSQKNKIHTGHLMGRIQHSELVINFLEEPTGLKGTVRSPRD